MASGEEPGPPPSAGSLEPAPAPAQEGGLRRLWPALLTLTGGAVPFLLMASNRQWRFSVPLGFLGCAVATWGLFDLLGTFEDDGEERVARRTSLRDLAGPLAHLGTSLAAHLTALSLAVAGVLPRPVLTAALLVPATFLWIVVALFQLGQRLGAWADDVAGEGILRRHGFWLVALTTLLYLPMLGSYSLSDPWETHYGEVAREILARDDWISTWWAQDGWFWSKPILNFWVQALAFSLLGVKYMPDEMVRTVAEGRFPQPEWAARMPIFLLSLLAVYLLYKAVAKVAGRRAGLLAGIVLVTMPYMYFIAHQTMTDLPYVGTLIAAMACLVLGFSTDPDRLVRLFEVRVAGRAFRLSAYHLLFGAVILCVLPQVLYLITRNVTLHVTGPPYGFRIHPDAFQFGSGGGNCGLPGNQACRWMDPVNAGLQPAYAGAFWAALCAVLLWITRGERRAQRLYFLGAWFFLSLSVMGKGAPGLVLPLFTAMAYIGAVKRWQDITRLELAALVLLVGCVALPWFVQMHARHGSPFVDRLIMHDMYKRAFVHVHDTNKGDDVSFRYYVWQLGYGLFPWTGLSAGGLLWWLRRGDRTRDGVGQLCVFMMLWFLMAFGMFTITRTKFHHYVFPLVPPTAVLTALLLDRLLGAGSPARSGRLGPYLLGIGAGATLVLYGLFRCFPRSLTGEALEEPPSMLWAALSLATGLGLAGFSIVRFGRRDAAPDEAPGGGSDAPPLQHAGHEARMLGAVGVASAVAVVLAGRDLFVTNKGDVEGQLRLMQLFTYNYRRPWPESLDFTGALVAFTGAATLLCLLLVVRRWRHHLGAFLCAVAVVWGAWGVNVYLVKASPHWGQRETILAYYEKRAGPHEPIVAYQMNWKGENFYTGNRIPAFVSSGNKFKTWLENQKKEGVRVVFFTTEHGRVNTLKRELGDVSKFEQLTDKKLNNKFFLARVEL